MYRGIEFGNDFLECSGVYRNSRRGVAEVASIQGTHTWFSCRNHDSTKGCSTTPVELMSFSSHLGRGENDVRCFLFHKQLGDLFDNSVPPMEDLGLRGLVEKTVSDERSVVDFRVLARICFVSFLSSCISSTLLTTR